ncbi:MAG: molybdenum transporter [Aquimarina sp.]|nr:molybdenum transporter [Aquimarina sp.]
MYSIKSRIWIEGQDGVFLGEGRVKLLKAIIEEGSLSKAALSINMSYKKAWKLIDSMNQNSKKPIVTKITGGSNGGGTFVTDYGKQMIKNFDDVNQRCWDFLDNELKSFNYSDES